MRVFGDDKYSGRRSGGNRGGYNNRDRGGRTEMFDAVCDKCGKDCKVPFRPSGDKPIFCDDCFDRDGRRDNNRRDGSRSYGDRSRSNGVTKEQMDSLNKKLDRIISLLEGKTETEEEEDFTTEE